MKHSLFVFLFAGCQLVSMPNTFINFTVSLGCSFFFSLIKSLVSRLTTPTKIKNVLVPIRWE